jgi:hypothetical protein
VKGDRIEILRTPEDQALEDTDKAAPHHLSLDCTSAGKLEYRDKRQEHAGRT